MPAIPLRRIKLATFIRLALESPRGPRARRGLVSARCRRRIPPRKSESWRCVSLWVRRTKRRKVLPHNYSRKLSRRAAGSERATWETCTISATAFKLIRQKLNIGMRSCQRHQPRAQYRLGLVLSTDQDRGNDLKRAAALLRESADAGLVQAKHQLGLLLARHPKLANSPDGRPFPCSRKHPWQAHGNLQPC